MQKTDKNIIRIMVDMSATLIHFGHIRLLKKPKTALKINK